MKKVAIIGGGVIGLATAYYLRKKNVDVVLIEKGELGGGASSGNAGLVSPTLSHPVPTPDLVGTSIKWLMKKDSPLYIKPSAMPALSGWLYQFWRHCNDDAYQRGCDAGFALSRDSLRLFDELEADGVSFEMHREGILCLYLDEKEMDGAMKELCIGANYGSDKPVEMTAKEVHAMVGEGILSDKVIGGLHLPDQRHLRPETFTRGLADWLEANGTEIKTHTAVTDVNVSNNTITSIQCGSERIEADQFLLAAGAWSSDLAKKIGFKIPVIAGKGYNITLTNPSISLKVPLHLHGAKVGVIPYEGAIRTVGTMELSGLNEDVDEQRLSNLRNAIRTYFNTPFTGDQESTWAGMRPMTPDGVPVLGQIPGLSNGYVATAHAMSGIFMSLPTGLYMSDLMIEGKAEKDLTPFSPLRFSSAAKV